LEERNPVC